MPLNFFKTVNSYGAMLNKLATANFFVALIVFYFITSQSPHVSDVIDEYTFEISLSGIKIPLGYFLPPLLVALFFRIVKMHDKISDLFRIRSYYDWKYVLEPMKSKVDSSVSKKVVLENRSSLMPKVFYKYASSRDENSIVDKHLIEMVLDQLTWYWMVIETSFLVLSTTLILLIIGDFEHVLVTFYFGLGLIIFAKILQDSCSKYTKREVEMILDTAPRRKEIKGHFDELQN